MPIRKFLEARRSNFESGTPTSAIDLQVLDLLSDAHHLALIKLVEQLRQHQLEWTRPSTSNLFGGAVDQSRGIHFQFYPNVSSTSWKKQLPHRRFVDAFAPIFVFIEIVQELDSRTPYSSNLQSLWAEICTDVTRFSLFGHLQPVGSTTNNCRDIIAIDTYFDTETIPTGFLIHFSTEVQIQKADLTQEMTVFRLETQEGLTTLLAQLSEIIDYINRGRDDKKGEDSSRGPKPESRSRPGPGGGGSSSEPSKKGGGSHKGRVSRSFGFSRWFS
ncbi:hypothetical protein F511_18012 [Dorcoceras hygrometricum]|uniref:Uncharacterized protein n=1 Tax=Dorcoceras hygrometricum TaxID=472368 RepID=A0A2Z7AKN5_9LAMI|nr:hypothetical protein F511_18012 [Dorcoceras hygrometricum]